MAMTVFFEDSFNAAHRLPHVLATHKCYKLHGHTYHVRIEVAGDVQPDGFIVDYEEIRKAWRPLFALLDHQTLNLVEGLSNPTCEVLAMWIGTALRREPPRLDVVMVEVRETVSCGATMRWDRRR